MTLAARITTIASDADNTKVSQIIQISIDVVPLQQDLDSLYKLAEANSMPFNAGKCQEVRY